MDTKIITPIPEEVLKNLKEPIPDHMYKTREIKKQKVSYLTGNTIVAKLNSVFGFQWSFEIVSKELVNSRPYIAKIGDEQKEQIQPPYIQVLGRLSIPAYGITKEQYGSKILIGTASDQEGAAKAATTDSLKKCATMLGIGIDADDFDEVITAAIPQAEYKSQSVQENSIETDATEFVPETIVVDWDAQEVTKLKEYKAILGITKNDQLDPYIREFFDSPNAIFNDITPANLPEFNKYMRKKAEEI